MAVGQLYYNVLDITTGKLMTSEQLKIQNEDGTETVKLFSDEETPERNLVKLASGETKWRRLSIQAPPGTQVNINGNFIYIGRTGIYELDPSITVGTVEFPWPTQPVLDQEQTDKYMQEARQEFQDAQTKLPTNEINFIATTEGAAATEEEVNKWVEEINAFIQVYNPALVKWYDGIYGIYGIEKTDLMNVIIDFVEKEEQ